MGEILFLAHRVPFPPDRGDKIRSHHLLKGLASIAPVHVATFGETTSDMEQKQALAAMAKTHALIERSKPLSLAGVQALLDGRPVSLTAFDHAAMRRYVAKTLGNHRIDTIFVFSGQMGQYVPEDFDGRVIVDLCDVDSLKFEAYAAAGQRPWINRREARLLKQEEARLVARADRTVLVSEEEAALLRDRLPHGLSARVEVLGNGIDATAFSPDAVEPQPDLLECDDPQIVFTGQMDYAPNIEAAQWMIGEVMPRLRQQFSRARFHVVGRAPPASLKSFHGEAGTRIWGEVPDTRPFLRAADFVAAPLMIARGVQNKVLEAMAMARPVIATPGAATGIPATDGKEIDILEARPEQWVANIANRFADAAGRAAMGTAARRFVVERMSWQHTYEDLARLVQSERTDRDAA